MNGFAFTTEALFALVASLALVGFAFVFDYGNPCIRLQEYALAQDAAQIAVKHYSGELIAFWKSGAEPQFLYDLAFQAGALNASLLAGGRQWGAECDANAITVKRALYDSGELSWALFTFCYP